MTWSRHWLNRLEGAIEGAWRRVWQILPEERGRATGSQGRGCWALSWSATGDEPVSQGFTALVVVGHTITHVESLVDKVRRESGGATLGNDANDVVLTKSACDRQVHDFYTAIAIESCCFSLVLRAAR